MHSQRIDFPEDTEYIQKDRSLPLKEIAEAVKGIKYGSVQIIIQDSKIVQIDKTEKLRLEKRCK